MSAHYEEVVVGGLKTACLSRGQMATLMVDDCMQAREARRTPKLVFTTNGHSIALAVLDKAFRRAVGAADILHADGQPAVFASRLFTRTPIPERAATTDFFHDAADAACDHGLRFYLLGGTEEANQSCVRIMRRLHPGLQIVGARHGYFSHSEESTICEEINASNADIVWVGLGLPLEQAFCVRNRHRLRASWLVTAGGCFNFVTGEYTRAPGWMQTVGLEWLYRLWKEPRRLFWRYAITNTLALFLLFTRTHAVAATGTSRFAPQDQAVESRPA